MPLLVFMQQWVMMLLLGSVPAIRRRSEISREVVCGGSGDLVANLTNLTIDRAIWRAAAPLEERVVDEWIHAQRQGALAAALETNSGEEETYLRTMRTAMEFIDDANLLNDNGIYVPASTIMKIYRMNVYDPKGFFGHHCTANKNGPCVSYRDGPTDKDQRNHLITHVETDVSPANQQYSPYVWVEKGACTDAATALRTLKSPLPTRPRVSDITPVANFDYVYNYPTSNSAVAKDVVPACLRSFWAATPVVLVPYGQSGSGKTYSFVGDREQVAPGIVPRLMNAIFGLLAAQGHQFMVTVQFGQGYLDRRIDMTLTEYDIVFPTAKAWVFNPKSKTMQLMYPLLIVERRLTKCDGKVKSKPCFEDKDGGQMGPYFEDHTVRVRDAYGRKIQFVKDYGRNAIKTSPRSSTATIDPGDGSGRGNGGTLSRFVRSALVEFLDSKDNHVNLARLASFVGPAVSNSVEELITRAATGVPIFGPIDMPGDVAAFLENLATAYRKNTLKADRLLQTAWFISGFHWKKAWIKRKKAKKIPFGKQAALESAQCVRGEKGKNESKAFRDEAIARAVKRIDDIVRTQTLAAQANPMDPGKIMEDEVTTPIQQLSSDIVMNWEELKEIWDAAMIRRVTCPTQNNPESSRSVLTGKITVYWQKYMDVQPETSYAISTIVFQDLPGSESGDMTAKGDKAVRKREGVQIRNDLLNLGMILGSNEPNERTNVVKDVEFILNPRVTTFVVMALTAKKNHFGAAQTLRIAHQASSGFVGLMEKPRLLAWFDAMQDKHGSGLVGPDFMDRKVFEQVCHLELKETGMAKAKILKLLDEILRPLDACKEVVDVNCLEKQSMWSNIGFSHLLSLLEQYREERVSAGDIDSLLRRKEQAIAKLTTSAESVRAKFQTWRQEIAEKTLVLVKFVESMKTTDDGLQTAQDEYLNLAAGPLPTELKTQVGEVKAQADLMEVYSQALQQLSVGMSSVFDAGQSSDDLVQRLAHATEHFANAFASVALQEEAE